MGVFLQRQEQKIGIMPELKTNEVALFMMTETGRAAYARGGPKVGKHARILAHVAPQAQARIAPGDKRGAGRSVTRARKPMAQTGLPPAVDVERARRLGPFQGRTAALAPSKAAPHAAALSAVCEAAMVPMPLARNVTLSAGLHIAYVTGAETWPQIPLTTKPDDAPAEVCPPIRRPSDQDAPSQAVDHEVIASTDHACLAQFYQGRRLRGKADCAVKWCRRWPPRH